LSDYLAATTGNDYAVAGLETQARLHSKSGSAAYDLLDYYTSRLLFQLLHHISAGS
jgi:hypothetical protein